MVNVYKDQRITSWLCVVLKSDNHQYKMVILIDWELKSITNFCLCVRKWDNTVKLGDKELFVHPKIVP